MGITAWHFCGKDMKLSYDDKREIRDGETLTVEGDIAMCNHGLHASRRIIDALFHATSPMICRVEMDGDVIEVGNKLVARSRRCVWHVDGTRLLHEFACRCAERALRRAGVTDRRCWDAIAAKRRWLAGKATAAELASARASAQAAVRVAAGAAEASARVADWAVEASALAAEASADWAAEASALAAEASAKVAEGAAEGAAEASALAAEASAQVAEWAAERAAQSAHLEAMVMAEREEREWPAWD